MDLGELEYRNSVSPYYFVTPLLLKHPAILPLNDWKNKLITAQKWKSESTKLSLEWQDHSLNIKYKVNLLEKNTVLVFSLLEIDLDIFVHNNLYCYWAKTVYDSNLVLTLQPDTVFDFANSLTKVEFLDTDYYRDRYNLSGDVKTHYINIGFKEGYIPNPYLETELKLDYAGIYPNFDESYYLFRYSVVSEFRKEFPTLTAFQFYTIYGFRMGHSCHPKQDNSVKCLNEAKLEHNFDVDWYLKKYSLKIMYPYYHYLNYGLSVFFSPNSWFEEEFYCKFYSEIMANVENKNLLSGFYHYWHTGYKEGRLPYHDSKNCLNIRMASITDPCRLIDRSLHSVLSFPEHRIVDHPMRIWIVVDDFNPDIFFGGYKIFLEFIDILIDLGYSIGFYLRTTKDESLAYFTYHYPRSKLSLILKQVAIYSPFNGRPFSFGRKDIFIAYSTWNGLIAHHFSQINKRKFILFIQEYEAVFHPNDSYRFMIEHCYRLPHYALFNSSNLTEYFRKYKLGVFNQDLTFTTFDYINPLTRTQPVTFNKQLLVYIRPEKHAERNLAELIMLVLEKLILRGEYADWTIVGFGSVGGPHVTSLPGGRKMIIYPRLEKDKYQELLYRSDVGLSLIFSPHPGLVHFDMASAGIITVTNTYETRPKEFFKDYPTILPAEPSVEGIITALISARKLAEDLKLRSRPFAVKVPSLTETFTSKRIKTIFSSL